MQGRLNPRDKQELSQKMVRNMEKKQKTILVQVLRKLVDQVVAVELLKETLVKHHPDFNAMDSFRLLDLQEYNRVDFSTFQQALAKLDIKATPLQIQLLFGKLVKQAKHLKYSLFLKNLLCFWDNYVYETVLFSRPPNYLRGQLTMTKSTVNAFSRFLQAYLLAEVQIKKIVNELQGHQVIYSLENMFHLLSDSAQIIFPQNLMQFFMDHKADLSFGEARLLVAKVGQRQYSEGAGLNQGQFVAFFREPKVQ